MAEIGLTEAAKLTGKDPSTIARRSNHKDIKKRLSFKTNDAGDRLYDVSELERVFGPLARPNDDGSYGTRNDAELSQRNNTQQLLHDSHLRESALLHNHVALLQEQLDIANKDRDHWRQQATYLLEDKSKKETVLDSQRDIQRQLEEQATRDRIEKEQLVKTLSDTQSRLETVRSSWIGRLFFKV